MLTLDSSNWGIRPRIMALVGLMLFASGEPASSNSYERQLLCTPKISYLCGSGGSTCIYPPPGSDTYYVRIVDGKFHTEICPDGRCSGDLKPVNGEAFVFWTLHGEQSRMVIDRRTLEFSRSFQDPRVLIFEFGSCSILPSTPSD